MLLATEEEKQIIALFKRGCETRAIAAQIRTSKKNVQRIIRAWKISEDDGRRPRVRGPRYAKRKPRREQQQAKWQAEGLCLRCGNPTSPDSSFCSRHLEIKAQRRKAAGTRVKCDDCGQPPVEGRARCAICLERYRALQRSIQQKRREAGLCLLCGKQPRSASRYQCDICREKAAARAAKQRADRRAAGLCTYCGKMAALDGNHRCETCYFKVVSQTHFGSVGDAGALKALFYGQKERCAYSGRLLVLGRNAELDHREPIAAGGTHDLANVHWVDHDVNQMKHGLTEEAFFGLIRDIWACRL